MRGENNSTAQTSPKLRPNFAQTINESVENGIIELIKENNKIHIETITFYMEN